MNSKHMRMKLMAEVQCWPIWDLVDGGNIDPATLPLPNLLVDQINLWASKFDAIYKLDEPNFHLNIAFASQEEENAFYDEGWVILKQLVEVMPDVEWWYSDPRFPKFVDKHS